MAASAHQIVAGEEPAQLKKLAKSTSKSTKGQGNAEAGSSSKKPRRQEHLDFEEPELQPEPNEEQTLEQARKEKAKAESAERKEKRRQEELQRQEDHRQLLQNNLQLQEEKEQAESRLEELRTNLVRQNLSSSVQTYIDYPSQSSAPTATTFSDTRTANMSSTLVENFADKLNWGHPPKDFILQGQAEYEKWTTMIQDFLMYNNANTITDGTWTQPAGAAIGHTPSREWQRWTAYNTKIVGVIRMTIGDGPRQLIEDLSNAKDIWEKLKRYRRTGALAYRQVFNEMAEIRLDSFSNVQEFANRIRYLNSEALRISKDFGYAEQQLIHIFFRGLGPRYGTFVDNQCEALSMKKTQEHVTLDDILERALAHESTAKDTTTSNVYAAKSSESTPMCTFPKCPRKVGHPESRCFTKHPHLREQYAINRKRRAEEALDTIRKKSTTAFAAQASDISHRFSRPSPPIEESPQAYGYMAATKTVDHLAWRLDSASDYHMAPSREGLIDFDESFRGTVKAFGDSPGITVEGRGTAILTVKSPDGPRKLRLPNIWVSPRFPGRLVSEYTLAEEGFQITTNMKKAVIQKDGTTIATATGTPKTRGWLLDLEPTTATSFQAFELPPEPALQLWHQRLAHIAPESIRKMISEEMVTGMSLKDEKLDHRTCETCVLAKARAHPHQAPITSQPAKRPFEFIFADLVGPVTVPGVKKEKANYILVITDDFSRLVYADFLEKKDQAVDKLIKFINKCSKARGYGLSRIRTDNGREFTNYRFRQFCEDNGIDYQTTATYSPESNGVNERQNQTIMSRVRAVMSAKNIPADAWTHIVEGVLWLKNRCPVAGRKLTPYELWSGIKPDLSHTKILGSLCWYNHPKESLKKFDKRASERILVGYLGSSLYVLWNPLLGTVEKTQDVEFDEAPVIKRPVEAANPPAKRSRHDDLVGVQQSQANPHTDHAFVSAPITDEDTIIVSCGAVTAAEPSTYEKAKAIIEESHREIARAFSTETLSPNDADRNAHTDAIDDDLNILLAKVWKATAKDSLPRTYKEAMLSPHASLWQEAFQAEYDALVAMDTWELVERPTNKPVLRGTWATRIKTDEQGQPTKFKARWCARGDLQTEGIDYEQTFSTVVRSMAYKLLFNRASIEDLEVEQMDVDLAFLNSPIDTEVYLEQPEGFHDGTDRVIKLKKTLYGLRQSPRAWYHTLKDFLLSLGFRTTAADASVFIRQDGVVVAVYIDDLLIIGSDTEAVKSVKASLSQRFSMKDLGPCKWYLGISVQRNRQQRTIILSQKAYIEKILQEFDLLNANPSLTPMAAGTKLRKAAPDYQAPADFAQRYQKAIGSLLYLALGTRPDIAFAVGVTSRYCSNPTKTHWTAVQRIFRYLKGTLNVCLEFKPGPQEPQLQGYTDASFKDCEDTLKSTAGYAFHTGSGLVSWQSKRLSTISTSTTEAEYTAQFRATLETLYLRNLASELWPNVVQGPTTLFGDNHGAIALAQNCLGHSKSKHFDLKLRKNQECHDAGLISYVEVPSAVNIADIFTKPLEPTNFLRLARSLGLTNIPQAPSHSNLSIKPIQPN